MGDDYTATTRAIVVTVQPFYLEDQSEPDEGRFVWAYRVRIHNTGAETVQLMSRTWRITDGRGRTIKVEGPGVVGEQPLLEAGDTFEYTSGTPLETPTGFMEGLYHMILATSGESFDVNIPAFSLDSPHSGRQLH
jgi:ApaG protein